MVFVSDTEFHKPKRTIELLAREPMIAVLLAAANFEWTVGRCILIFGNSANVDVRRALEKTHGLNKYKELWEVEIRHHDPLAPPLCKVIKDWQKLFAPPNTR
jgi:hypothetical protein